MEPFMTEPRLPLNGQVIAFAKLPAGSLLRPDVVYRVEKKPLETEYLLVDVASGHAGRVPERDLMVADWVDAGDRVKSEPASELDEAAPAKSPLPDDEFMGQPA
jgi:hypothetical protein